MDQNQIVSGKSGRYKIVKALGEGGQGKTYLITRENDQRQFVLKWLAMESVEKWKVIDRFKREGEILKSMSFPGIPQYIELIEEEAGLGIIQTYIDGASWQDLIDRQMPVHIDQAEEQLTGLLQILNYLTTFHPPIIHRDISPKNIMVDQQGVVWLIDFGSVQAALHQHSKTVTTMGTFGYMAPEQIMGQARPQSDLFSLGISFVARLTNTTPDDFILDTTSGGIDLKKMGLELPPYLMQVIGQMIAPGLEKRFKTPGNALNRLESKHVAQIPQQHQQKILRRIPDPGKKVKKPKKWYQKWRYRLGIVLIALFLGGYTTSLISEKGEITTYGGWFSGHGNLISSMTSTFFGDASAFVSPNSIRTVAFSPDGKIVASLARRGVIVRQKDGGKIIFRDDELRGEHLYFSDNNQLWVQGYRGKLVAIDLKTKKRKSFQSAENWVLQKEGITSSISCRYGMIVQGDDLWVICSYYESSKYTHLMVELNRGEIIKDFPFNSINNQLYPVTGKSEIAAFEERNGWYYLKVWDFKQSKIVMDQQVKVKGSRYSMKMKTGRKGAHFLIQISNRYFVVDRTGKTICTLNVSGYSYRNTMDLHEEKQLVAVSGRDKIYLYNLKNCQEIQQFAGHTRYTNAIAFSPDGTQLLSGGYDQTVKLWQIDGIK